MKNHAIRQLALLACCFPALALAGTSASSAAPGGAQSAPDGATVYFITPADGDTLESPFRVVMGLSGMGVAPAGVDRPGTGHHHLLINAPAPQAGVPIPSDAHHRHFGGGQTEAMIELEPGEHTLQLVIGDLAHRPHAAPVASDTITITVAAPNE